MFGKRLLIAETTDITTECDFFGDGTGRYLWTFNSDFNDTCGRFTGWSVIEGSINTTDFKFGGGSFSAGNLWRYDNNYGGGLSGSSLIASIWAKGTAWSDNRIAYLWYFGSGSILYVDSSNILTYLVYSSTQGNFLLTYDCSGFSSTGWYNIAVTHVGTTVTLYVNGLSVSTTTTTGYLLLQNGSPFNIGAYLTDNGDGWRGLIDQYRLFNKTNASQNDITALYNEGQ